MGVVRNFINIRDLVMADMMKMESEQKVRAMMVQEQRERIKQWELENPVQVNQDDTTDTTDKDEDEKDNPTDKVEAVRKWVKTDNSMRCC